MESQLISAFTEFEKLSDEAKAKLPTAENGSVVVYVLDDVVVKITENNASDRKKNADRVRQILLENKITALTVPFSIVRGDYLVEQRLPIFVDSDKFENSQVYMDNDVTTNLEDMLKLFGFIYIDDLYDLTYSNNLPITLRYDNIPYYKDNENKIHIGLIDLEHVEFSPDTLNAIYTLIAFFPHFTKKILKALNPHDTNKFDKNETKNIDNFQKIAQICMEIQADKQYTEWCTRNSVCSVDNFRNTMLNMNISLLVHEPANTTGIQITEYGNWYKGQHAIYTIPSSPEYRNEFTWVLQHIFEIITYNLERFIKEFTKTANSVKRLFFGGIPEKYVEQLKQDFLYKSINSLHLTAFLTDAMKVRYKYRRDLYYSIWASILEKLKQDKLIYNYTQFRRRQASVFIEDDDIVHFTVLL